MRLKVVSTVVCVLLCLSLVPMLLPQMLNPVNAMDTMSLTWTMTSADPGNWRPHNLQKGDEVIQFGRPNLTVGTNPTGGLSSMHASGTVSGDWSGTANGEWNTLDVSWNELGGGNGTGYVIGKMVFDDGQGNSATAIIACDFDSSSPSTGVVDSGFSGSVLSTSATGVFAGQVLIGTMSGTSSTENGVLVSHTGTAQLRRYSAGEISGQTCAATATWSVDNGYLLGTSYGAKASDEFMQFTRSNVLIPAGNVAFYAGGGSSTGSGTVGSHSGTFTQSWNNVGIPGSDPAYQGWLVGKMAFATSDGEANAVVVMDSLGVNTSGNSIATGYAIALMENATGSWAGRDYYMVGNSVSSGGSSGTSSLTGTMYYLTPSVGVTTATHTGTATLAPDSGSMEDLAAVSEALMPSDGKPDILFPHGFFQFDITGLTAGQSVTLTITLPSAVPDDAQYWKYGPTPLDNNPHWYNIPWTRVSSNAISITLIDGSWGDDIVGVQDGTIIDQGGPGWPGPSGGGGGHSAPVFPSLYIGIGAALGAGVVAYAVRRWLAAR